MAARTVAERQAEYKQRMYDAGYKRKEFWVQGDPIGRMQKAIRELDNWKSLPVDQRPSADCMVDILHSWLWDSLDELTGGEGLNYGRKPENAS
jgi:hypothetical protein